MTNKLKKEIEELKKNNHTKYYDDSYGYDIEVNNDKEIELKETILQAKLSQKQEDDERFEEFIRLLKEYLITSAGQSKLLKQDRSLIFNFLDKFVGPKLKGE